MTNLLSTISEISAFKRREHEFEYDMEKKIAQRNREPHHVYINGKVWKTLKTGEPVEFNSHAHAHAAAQSILKRNPNKYVAIAHHSFLAKHGGTDPGYAKKMSGKVEEGFQDDFLKMVQKTHPSARMVTSAQRKKETDELMKKREAAGRKPVHAQPEKTYPLGGYDPVSNRSYSEEVEQVEGEQLDELSSDTLRRYMGKARKAISKDTAYLGDAPAGSKRLARINKRVKGFRTAWAKADAKESVEQVEGEQLDELSPGWMLRADPKLAAKLRAKQKLARARQAAYGNPEAGKSMKEDVKLDEANDDILDVKSTYQKIAIKHLKDSSRKDATPTQKMYATKMMKRALEASKMDDHTAALNHYRGMSEGMEDATLDEVLTKSDPASTWIRDFIKSKSSRLAGDTKKQRIKRALGAYYAKQQENLDAAYTTINVGK